MDDTTLLPHTRPEPGTLAMSMPIHQDDWRPCTPNEASTLRPAVQVEDDNFDSGDSKALAAAFPFFAALAASVNGSSISSTNSKVD